jgi:hypothetical protein
MPRSLDEYSPANRGHIETSSASMLLQGFLSLVLLMTSLAELCALKPLWIVAQPQASLNGWLSPRTTRRTDEIAVVDGESLAGRE